MPRDLDPQIEDAARRQLGRLIDAIETGPGRRSTTLRLGGSQPIQVVDPQGPGRARLLRSRTPIVAGIAAALVVLLVGAVVVLAVRPPM